MSAISGRYAFDTHRSNVTAVDKIVVPTITAVKNNSVAGSLATATVYNVAVAPGNVRGTAGVSNIVAVTTDTPDKSITISVPAVAGAVYYDVFLSTAATPQRIKRVNEMMLRSTGATIAADGTVTGAGEVNKIIVKGVGTGKLTSHADFAVNHAYIDTGITAIPYQGPCTMKMYIEYDVGDLAITPELVLRPFFSRNEYNPTLFFAGAKTTVTDPVEDPILTMELTGVGSVKVLVDTMKGTDATLKVYVELVPV